MLLAIKDHASDMHFEPFEEEFKIRVRPTACSTRWSRRRSTLAFASRRASRSWPTSTSAERRLPAGRPIELTVAGHPIDLACRAADDVRRERRDGSARPVGSSSTSTPSMNPETLPRFRKVNQQA